MRGTFLGLLIVVLAGCGRVGQPMPMAAPSGNAALKPAADALAAAPATAPATQPVAEARGPSRGVSLTIATVVAEANGQPIFADRVLAQLAPGLAAKARERGMNSERFRAFAQELIHKKILAEINNELEFAAAQQNLDQEKKRIATALTMEWRRKRVAEAGGSEAIAQARMIEATGLTLDEATQRQYREFMGRIYYETKVIPLAAVSADEMRAFYDANREDFRDAAQVRFRIIKVPFGQDRAAAQKRINEAHDRAIAGHDFATLAAMYNDDPLLKESGGLEPWVARGSYVAAPPVEQAVWKLETGGVTVPIEHKDAWYLARLEDRKLERNAPFDDPKVQEAIRGRLWAEKFDKVRKAEQVRLWNSGYKLFTESMLQTAVDMAMQMYPQLAKAE